VEVVVGNKQIAMKRVVSVKVDYFGVLAATVRQHLVVVLALMYIKPNLAQVYYNYHTIPYHTIPYHTIPYHTIPYHTHCQFIKIWHYCTIKIQLFQFISIQFLKIRPVMIIFLTFRMVFRLMNPVVIFVSIITFYNIT
jgi:hypothetical protein